MIVSWSKTKKKPFLDLVFLCVCVFVSVFVCFWYTGHAVTISLM